MTRAALLLTALGLTATGCRGSDDAPKAEAPATAETAQAPKAAPQPAEPAPKPTPKPPPKPDPRQPRAFAEEWARLRSVPPAQLDRQSSEVREAWHDRIYTWTGYALPGLCIDARRTCALHVFERRTTPAEARLDGYFPPVAFTEPAYAALKTACKGKTGCVVTFRGHLAESNTHPGEPLLLRFADATFVEGRDPTPEEQWFGRRPGEAPPKRAPSAKLRTGEPRPSAVTVKPRTF